MPASPRSSPRSPAKTGPQQVSFVWRLARTARFHLLDRLDRAVASAPLRSWCRGQRFVARPAAKRKTDLLLGRSGLASAADPLALSCH